MKRIYMDHAATTPVAPEVLKAMMPFFGRKYGNASSIHSFGQEARDALDNSREILSRFINAEFEELIFTSGGTESDNIAIIGAALAGKEKNHIITSRIEHHAVLHTCKFLEKYGFKVTYLAVDRYGFVKPEDVEKAITKNTVLVSIMHANNEIGTIEPVREIGRICRDAGVLFHTDAVQSFGKIPLNVKKMNIDMLSASAHKIYGPKGAGLLYIRNGVAIKPLMHGGGHEFGMRSGTENIPGIVGFAKAAELAGRNMDKWREHETRLRKMLARGVLEIPDSWLNGHPEKRIPGNASFCFRFIEGESLVVHLSMIGVAASTGSACSSKDLRPSHVLTAIGLKPFDAHGSLRLTLGKDNTKEDVDFVIKELPGIVSKLRKISPMGRK